MRDARINPALLLTVVISLAFVLAMNLRGTALPTFQGWGEPPADSAPSYGDLVNIGPPANRHWDSRLEYLRAPETELIGDRDQARAERALRRAYDGAPPVVPHAIDQQATPNCLACHAEGLRVGDRLAPKISHPELTSCLQCHATTSQAPVSFTVDNSFVGIDSQPASAVYGEAPPQMPHGTWMRQDCLSCHGPLGQPGLRTGHPERQNCLQCHTPPATAQRPRTP